MALTKEQSPLTATAGPAPPRRRRWSTRVVLGWAAVGFALATTAVLAVRVLTPDRATPASAPSLIAEHGSIRAIDHAAEIAAASAEQTPTFCCPLRAEHGSIRAIDHAAETRPTFAHRGLANYGSIVAIDHAAEVAARSEQTPTFCCPLRAEHGSIRAIEHAAESAQP